MEMPESSNYTMTTTTTTTIDSSNIGFQLLKKHGWKEGTGLGISEQGRLEPVQAYVKYNKRGLGADKRKEKVPRSLESSLSNEKNYKEQGSSKQSKSAKKLSKKQRKMQELEEHLQEKEFERCFYREFWPDNV